MNNLNQTDFEVRLQLSSCCSGAKGAALLNKIKIGSKDVNCKLQELQVIQGMLKYLKCYKVLVESTDEVLATGSITVTNVEFQLMNTSTINIYVNGVNISGPVTATSSSETAFMTLLAAAINDYQDTYVATYTSPQSSVRLTGTCQNDVITYTVSETQPVTTLTTTDFSGGICTVEDTDNCLTEAQVNSMFEYIDKKCDICFQAPGFDYEE